MVKTLLLPPDTAAVSQARQFVRGCCQAAGMTGDDCYTAVLLTSELVTNAFLHGHSDARLTVVVEPGAVLIEVSDENPSHPQPVEPDEEALGGRGLLILCKLAARWGVRDDPVGKTVWFEVAAN